MTIRVRTMLGIVLPGLLLCAGCSPAPQTAASRANEATVTACREKAEQVYVRQNRDELYRNDNSSTPFSAGPSTGTPGYGLSSLYAHDQMIDDCVRNTGTQTQRTDEQEEAHPGGQGAPTP